MLAEVPPDTIRDRIEDFPVSVAFAGGAALSTSG